jgi:hypothetical protein
MRTKWYKIVFFFLLALVAIFGLLMLFNPWSFRDRVIWHVNALIENLRSSSSSPEGAGFEPVATGSVDLQGTLTALAVTPSLATVQDTPLPTLTSTPNPTPIPQAYLIQGGTYYSQNFGENMCAPANLATLLSYWGWHGKPEDVSAAIKPYSKDKNVMPYEMQDYAVSLGYGAAVRVGGDVGLLKRFVAAGIPVLVERGVFFRDLSGVVSWMGHYAVVIGYDDATGMFTIQDTFIKADYLISYSELETEWQSFNYIYLIIYTPDRESEVDRLLGADLDETVNYRNAYIKASNEVYQYSGVQQFFAWYNVGTNLVKLEDYSGAANAYDQAFALYNTLPEDKTIRPYRMLWYQTGPYFAYYYMGRYEDVIDLATNLSIDVSVTEPALEESFYWRGMAEEALGEADAAIDDYQKALHYHPGFGPALDALARLGITP